MLVKARTHPFTTTTRRPTVHCLQQRWAVHPIQGLQEECANSKALVRIPRRRRLWLIAKVLLSQGLWQSNPLDSTIIRTLLTLPLLLEATCISL